MLNRVTNLTMNAAAQRSLQTQQAKLAELQDKATSLNKISRPSDDPAATAQALATRSLQAANAQYGRNIDDGNTWLTAADSALEQATNVMRRVKDLTVMAGNGSLPQTGKDAIAAELESLNQDLISIANSQHLGRNIFAGSSDKAGAFTAGTPRDPKVPGDTGTPPTFNGTGNNPVERRISATQTVRVDADGAGVFGNGNGSLNQSGKDAIAAELESLNKDLVSIANTQHLGRNVFAGSSDAAGAFTPGTPRNPSVPSETGTPPTFNGTGISSVERRISATQTVRVDADGAEIFGNGAGSVFDTVSKLAADLRTGTDVAPRVADVDTAFKKIVNGRAEIGTRQAQLERAGNVNTELEASLDAQRTGIEKADLGSVIMDLKLQETNYQVALAATARVLQPTLMDFLR